MSDKVYLGDGVYANRSERGIVLTTENGITATNTIVLEPEIVEEFERYIARLRERADDDLPPDWGA